MSTSHIAISVFAIFSVLNGATASLTVFPQNEIIVAGQFPRFNCTTDRTVQPNPISWTFQSTAKYVSYGCSKLAQDIDAIPSGLSCDLVIYKNTTASSGTYSCYDDTPAPTDTTHTAVLLILVAEPKCTVDPLPVYGQPVNVICTIGSVTYGTTPPITLPMTLSQWTTCETWGISNATTVGSGIVQLPEASFTKIATEKLIRVTKCDIHFEFNDSYTPQPPGNWLWAINDVNYTVYTNETRVQFCPENMNVTLPPYYAGSELYCFADAYYLPTYNWTNNLNTTYPTTVGQTLILPTDGGEFDFNCWAFATGNLTGVCNATIRVHGFAIKCPHNVQITPKSNANVIEIGDSYNCTATSNPSANYTWYNTSNGAAYTTNQQTVTITSSGPFTLICNATVTKDNTTCTNSSSPFIGYARKCPKIVTISPQRSVVHVGDTFNCSSDSDPAAKYSWHSANATGYTVNPDNSITINAPGSFSLICTANLTVNGVSCVTSNQTNGTAIECPGSVSITPQNKTVFVGATYNCSTSSYPQANYTWVDSSNVVRSHNQTVTVEKAGDFSFTCNASIPVGGTTCFNTSTITGRAISCPPNVTISPQNTQPLAGTVYNCSSDGPANDTTYTLSLSDGTTVSSVSSPYTANNPGSFQLTCTASVSVGGVPCSNYAVLNITVIATTTTPQTNTSDSTTNGSFGDTNSTAQNGGDTTVGSGSNTVANTDQVVAYILSPILALVALLAIALCIPFVIRFVRRRAAATAAAAKLPLARNQIPLQPPNFRRQQPVWNWYEKGRPSLYEPGSATRPDLVNGYSKF